MSRNNGHGPGPTPEMIAELDRRGREMWALVEADIAAAATAESAPVRPVSAYRGSRVGSTLPLVSLAELFEKHTGDVDWLVPGYFGRGEVVFVAGAGESLKSWAMAHLAAAIDGRFRWLGAFEVTAERVLFLEQERALNLAYQMRRIGAAERVDLGSDRLRIVLPQILPLSEVAAQSELRQTIAGFRPDVVIINALRDVLGKANENSPTDLAPLLRSLGMMAEEFQCCIIIIDHFNKSGLAGSVRGNQAHAGTSQKHAEADGVLIAERPRDELGKGIGPATFSVSKRRSGEPGGAFAVSVTDTTDGGVLVRAEPGVAVSPAAQLVYAALKDGPAMIADLSEALGRSKDAVKQSIGELRRAGLIQSAGPQGKDHTYWRNDDPNPPVRPVRPVSPYISSRVGSESQSRLINAEPEPTKREVFHD